MLTVSMAAFAAYLALKYIERQMAVLRLKAMLDEAAIAEKSPGTD
ncbi:MAG: hypothetical protein PHO08_14805 [Methylococcales bacterium]|nr:hypothetical protein [Methylococcales bacterium]